MTQSTPTVKMDLDQATEDLWLLRNLSSGFADEPLARLAALIAELRAARAELTACDEQLGFARASAERWYAIVQEHRLDQEKAT